MDLMRYTSDKTLQNIPYTIAKRYEPTCFMCLLCQMLVVCRAGVQYGIGLAVGGIR
jgi:hypothetical protein